MSLEEAVFGPPSDVSEAVKRFADERIRPVTAELDATGGFPSEIYHELAQMGIFGMTVPTEAGGGGGSFRDFADAVEMLSYGYASVADQAGLVEIVGHLLARHGTDAQHTQRLEPLLRAEQHCAYAITEPEAGSDVGSIRTRATRTADGWTLRGEKIYIHNAPVADFALVLAVTDPSAGKRGMSVFVVPMDASGVSITNKSEKMGQRASPLAGIHFDDVVLAEDALLGEEGRGFHYVMWALDIGRVGIASLSLGISRAALIAACEQARTREQFGRPIGANQGVAFPIADMATEYRAAQMLVHDAADRLDRGERSTIASSMAKLYASEACVRHASAAVQVFGGSGYIRGYEVERLLRDARITLIYEGTSEIQRMVISRDLLQ